MPAGTKRYLSEVALPRTPSASLDAATLDFVTGVPTYAQNRDLQKRYDKRLQVYNWTADNTRRIIDSYAKARVSTYVAHWGFFGDSKTDNYNGTTFDTTKMWPHRMRDSLVGANVPLAGSGLVRFATGSGATADTRWTTAGGAWTRTAGTIYGYSTVNGASATFLTTDGAGSEGAIIYTNQSTAMNYSVKDAAGNVLSSGALTISGGASMAVKTFTGLANAVSITVTHNGSGGTFAILIAAGIWRTNGLMVSNFAMYGSWASGTNGWQDTATNYYNYLNAAVYALQNCGAPPQAWFGMLAANDLIGSASNATIVTAMQTIRTYLTANSPSTDVVYLGEYQPGAISNGTYDDLTGRMFALADTLDIPFVDLYGRSGGYTIANGLSMMGDSTHEASGAQIDTGTLVGNLIAAAQDQTTLVVPNVQAVFTYSGTIATTTDSTATTARWYNNTGRTLTFKKITLGVQAAPTGAAILVDLNKNGTTMFTTQGNRPTIAISGTTGSSTNPDVLTVADGDYLTVNIDQVGSTLPGTTLTVTITLT